MSDSENNIAPGEDETLQEVPTKTKKESSYTYWVNNDPNFFTNGTKVDIKPKPIQEEEFKRQNSYDKLIFLPFKTQSASRSPETKKEQSAWNTMGTW